MKAALLAALLLVSPVLLAQQGLPPSQPDQPAAAPADTPSAAPQLGHPLDPADVDVLTGRNKPETRRAYAQPYYSISPYGYGGAGYVPMRNNGFLLNSRRPFGFLGAGSGLVFFGRNPFVNPRPVIVLRP